MTTVTKPIFYATGDPHLPERAGGGAWAGLHEISGDSLYALTRVVDLCVRDGADLILPGDNFDGPDPEPGAVAPVYAQVRRLEAAGLKVYYVLGNHDAGRDWLAPAGPAAVNVSGVAVTTATGLTITGLSNVATKEEFVTGTSGLKRTDIGVYHQAWSELIKSGRFSISQLPDHKLSVCGDVHVRAVLDKPTHPRRVISGGALSPQSAAEFDGTAVFAISPGSSAKKLEVAAVPMTGRDFRRYDVKSAESADEVMAVLATMRPDARLPKDLASPLLALRMDADVPGFVDAAERLAADRGVVLRFVAGGQSRRGREGATVGGRQPAAEDLVTAVQDWDGDCPPPSRILAGALVRLANQADRAKLLREEWEKYRASVDPDRPAEEVRAPAPVVDRVV